MSKKKQLLEERNVRRFMKLSGQGTVLAESFLDKINEMELEGEEELAPAPIGDLGPELEDDELPLEGDADEVVVKDLVDAIADAITAETGIDVSVTGDGAEEPLPMEDELGEPEGNLDQGLPVEDEVPLQENKDEIDEDLEAADVEVQEGAMDEDALVAEIARRVARRLLRESAKTKK